MISRAPGTHGAASPSTETLLAEAKAALGRGDDNRAEQLYRQVRALTPQVPGIASNHGNVLLRLGRLAEATAAYRAAVALDPDCAAYHSNLANALFASGATEESVTTLRLAVLLDPANADFRRNLGNVLYHAKAFEEAVKHLQQAIALRPDFGGAWADLGNVFFKLDELEKAEDAYRHAVRLHPKVAELYSNLSIPMRHLERLDEAEATVRRAIELRPDFAPAHSNLGGVLARLHRWEESLASFREAIRLDPAYAEPWFDLSHVYQMLGRPKEALAAVERALILKPDYPEARLGLGLVLLKLGQHERGWEEYEYRWKVGAQGKQARPAQYIQPWQGEALAGKRILIWHEQGFGDTLQFCRYAADLAGRGATVVMQAPEPLWELMRGVKGVAEVVTDLPPDFGADFQIPMVSLPRLLKARWGQSLAPAPYLHAEAEKTRQWEKTLAGLTGLRVGLVWAGDPRPNNRPANLTDRRRSLSLSQLQPLAGIEGVNFISLQKGARAKEIGEGSFTAPILDLTDKLNSFADTAALIANLDLVIAVDTSVAHLAGALGKEVWILSRLDGCWRWLHGRDDTPWYPSARLFRQTEFSDWAPVIAAVATELSHRAAAVSKQY